MTARPGAGKKLARVLELLRERYGPRRPGRPGSAVRQLVGTILSQNTTGANASAGLRRLWRRFRSWRAVAEAPVAEIERCIRACGLSRTKAPRIKRILQQIRRRGKTRAVSLAFLGDMPVERATEYLLAFDGVGPKTAACVLMFAFHKPVFPVDTHVRRVTERLGLLPEGTSPERAQELLTPSIAPSDRYEMHVLLIAHGRQTCRALNPRCAECPLLSVCPFGRQARRRQRPARQNA